MPDDDESPISVSEAKRLFADWKAAQVPMAERRPLLLRALDRIYA